MRTKTLVQSVRVGDYLVVKDTPENVIVMHVTIPLVNMRTDMVTVVGELRSARADGRSGHIDVAKRYYTPGDEVTVIRVKDGGRGAVPEKERESLVDREGRTAGDIFEMIGRPFRRYSGPNPYMPPFTGGRPTETEKGL